MNPCKQNIEQNTGSKSSEVLKPTTERDILETSKNIYGNLTAVASNSNNEDGYQSMFENQLGYNNLFQNDIESTASKVSNSFLRSSTSTLSHSSDNSDQEG